jgi:hypothetical protein
VTPAIRDGADAPPACRQDLPPLSLIGRQVTVRELTFPPGLTSPKHTHPGFVFGYVLEGRFHLYGPHGAQGVSWGDWPHFLQFVACLNWFLPKALIPATGVVEAIIEFALAVALLVGIYERIVAWTSVSESL